MRLCRKVGDRRKKKTKTAAAAQKIHADEAAGVGGMAQGCVRHAAVMLGAKEGSCVRQVYVNIVVCMKHSIRSAIVTTYATTHWS